MVEDRRDRDKLNEACLGIARLEEQSKTLFYIAEKMQEKLDKALNGQGSITVKIESVSTRVTRLEDSHKSTGRKNWVIAIVSAIAAVIVAVVSAIASVMIEK